jgi:hypothetical protein
MIGSMHKFLSQSIVASVLLSSKHPITLLAMMLLPTEWLSRSAPLTRHSDYSEL